MIDYTVELTAVFDSIVNQNETELELILVVRGIRKNYKTNNQTSITRIQELNLTNGEKVRFLYKTQTEWLLKRPQDNTIERHYRRDD